jgi:mannosylglucosylglycerate synthase
LVARVVIVSFRLGGSDGVAIEAAKWRDALIGLGHDVTTVAGEGRCDVVLPGLAMHATSAPGRDELERAFDGADLVIVENMVSLPLNPAARDALYDVLDGRRAILHHHDLAWQREATAHLEGPRDRPDWHHVAINELSRRQLAERGVAATTIYNSFDCDPPAGDREGARAELALGDGPLLLLASRAIARKNVAGALALSAALDGTLWLLGPSEDGYEDRLVSLIGASGVDVRRGPLRSSSVHDAYAACDLVVMSSTWEGFGNPVLESVTHRRPLALHAYPVAEEIRSFGFGFFELGDVGAIAAFLARPDPALLDRNLELAREHFDVASLPARLAGLLAAAGLGDAPVGWRHAHPR